MTMKKNANSTELARWFIAGDWGTSNLRLFLCEHQQAGLPVVHAQRSGPGISKTDDPEAALFDLADEWINDYPAAPIVLSGMVGANIGWQMVPYQQCPADITDLATGALSFLSRGRTITILPGASCSNILGQPDVMRGEETQILGWVATQKSHSTGNHLLCLPGTHSKWAHVENGKIKHFITGFTGELYNVLSEHSILLSSLENDTFDNNAFLSGVAVARDSKESELLHLLFSVRSKQITGELETTHAASYLSGLIIGTDAFNALTIFSHNNAENSQIHIIGDGRLNGYYKLALETLGIASHTYPATDMCMQAYQNIFAHAGELTEPTA